ncbi:hypothetical protein [Pedobacter sp. GR22-10]|uniref:AbiTii domain-containing protein n=1 Tax=Pedobacter sp. GR22-10 TaxID=2994472 RepID=UPI0022461BEF|nr:hypothetical protein [Pedobacter sp. GR22-10]MCX2430562.1 hypothetical protein [Pedobacter sp. GR22-10]
MDDNRTFLLQQVIDDLLDPNLSLESPLLKLNYLARLIKNESLQTFTDLEINGYKEAKMPKYRLGRAQLMVKFQAGSYEHTKELPLAMIEKSYREAMEHVPVAEGIKVLEAMSAKTENGSDMLSVSVPLEYLHLLQEPTAKLYRSNTRIIVVGATIITNSNIVTQILSTVRSRLLAFVMEIGEEFGYQIEVGTFRTRQSENNQTVNNYIRNEITNHGSNNITNTGGDSKIEVKPGNTGN